MILYCHTDLAGVSITGSFWFERKQDALDSARSYAEDYGETTVEKVVINGPFNKKAIVRLLNREGYVKNRETIAVFTGEEES